MTGEMDTSEMTAEWDIASAIDSLSTAREGIKLMRQELEKNKETIKESFDQAVIKTMRHEQILKSKGRVDRFIRATSFSDTISHHYILSQHLQNVFNKCK